MTISQSQITNSGSDGLQVWGSGATVSDNVISGNKGNGITLGAGNNLVVGNIVGLVASGDAADANVNSGIVAFNSGGNTIGGTTSGDRNVVSGNGAVGIAAFGGIATGNLIEGNYVGTDSTGTFAIGNGSPGVLVFDGASSNTIGPRNVISGNLSSGIQIFDDGTATSDNLILGNLIGTDKSGTVAIGNTFEGIVIDGGASNNTVGGVSSSDRNIISGNDGDGIQITDMGTNLNVVEGNYIGTDVTGTVGLGNNGNGISIINNASDDTIGGAGSGPISIDAFRPEPGNVIADNGDNGVWIAQEASSNLVEGNYIGVDKTGAAALGNGLWGVIVDQSTKDTIGGTATGAGNVISANDEGGLAIYGGDSTHDLAEGNFIGTDVSGTVPLGNGYGGVYVGSGSLFSDMPAGSASYATIGGSVAGPGNLISGNDFDLTGNGGIVVYGSGASYNLVEGNFIGVDESGTVALANQGVGVDIFGGATSNTVGGVTGTTANVISGNAGDGLDITGPDTADNVVEGNHIGVDQAGSTAVANTGSGITISDSSDNTIGGLTGGAGNVVSGNGAVGIWAIGSTSSYNQIEGNFIGTDFSGTVALPNYFWGIELSNAPDNVVGGTSSAAQNVISGNNEGGVAIYGGDAIDDVVEGNLIGVDLSGTVALGNGYSGVYVGAGSGFSDGPSGSASDATIGGTATGAGNIISANGNWGLWISARSDRECRPGNIIGTDKTGTAPAAQHV